MATSKKKEDKWRNVGGVSEKMRRNREELDNIID